MSAWNLQLSQDLIEHCAVMHSCTFGIVCEIKALSLSSASQRISPKEKITAALTYQKCLTSIRNDRLVRGATRLYEID